MNQRAGISAHQNKGGRESIGRRVQFGQLLQHTRRVRCPCQGVFSGRHETIAMAMLVNLVLPTSRQWTVAMEIKVVVVCHNIMPVAMHKVHVLQGIQPFQSGQPRVITSSMPRHSDAGQVPHTRQVL
eukprot:scaffold4599_cov219-Amphora_coffeaeformis.AAC.2